MWGYAMAQLVKALRYKLEDLGVFDSCWCHWVFSLEYSFRPHSGLGSTQPVTEISTRNISCAVEAAGA
jgi:hypothetical protein